MGADATNIFKPEGGEIRVYGDLGQGSTQARHTLVSAGTYSKYTLWLEYRWGTKTFAPYQDVVRYPRDAGILFHLHNNTTVVWPSSVEFQIKDGFVGDIFTINATCTSLGLNGGRVFAEAAAGGTVVTVTGSGFTQHRRSTSFPNLELPQWNSLEMQVNGGTAVFIVNGKIVNRVLSVRAFSGGAAVTSGPIALQAEHAEVFYRNIRIQVLP